MSIKDKLAKLIDVKSIVTLILTLVFSYLAITSAIADREFVQIFLMIISFYFGTQHEKGDTKKQ